MADYPVRADVTRRPFRLWSGKAELRWRYYADWRRAVNAAFIELKWSPVGTVIEVIDIRFGKLLGQYRRGTQSVTFHHEVRDVKK